jgi:hypothetical protein
LEIADWKHDLASEGALASGDLLQSLASIILLPGHIIQWLGGPGWLALTAAVVGCVFLGWLTVKGVTCLTTRSSGT